MPDYVFSAAAIFIFLLLIYNLWADVKTRHNFKAIKTVKSSFISPMGMFILPSVLIILFLVNFFWNYYPKFHAIWGDDLLRFVYFHGIHNIKQFVRQSFLSLSLGKYRPVTEMLLGIDYMITGYNPEFFRIINIILNFVLTATLFFLVREITKKWWTGFIIALVYLTNRFNYYNVYTMHGVFEVFCLILLGLIVIQAVKFIRDNDNNAIWLALILNFILIFTYERYIVLVPCIILAGFLNRKIDNPFRILISKLALLPFFIQFMILQTYNGQYFIGTERENIFSDIGLKLHNLRICILNAAGIPVFSDDEYFQIGYDYNGLPIILKIFIVAAILLSLIFFAFYIFKLIKNFKKGKINLSFMNADVFIFLLSVFAMMWLAGSMTVRVELRFIVPIFMLSLVLIAFIFDKISVRQLIPVSFLILLSVLFISANIYYKSNLSDKLGYFNCQLLADDLYSKTVEKQGKHFLRNDIYLVGPDWLDWWSGYGSYFSQFYPDTKYTMKFQTNFSQYEFRTINNVTLIRYNLDTNCFVCSTLRRKGL
jgi:hypothetical protein